MNADTTTAARVSSPCGTGRQPDVPSHTGICFRGKILRGVKGFWHGTQRSVSPEDTLERIRPTFPIAGLTRVANITGLDRIGIPVTIAIRPNAKTLSTSSGKGVSLEAAKTSAAMEAIELFHAEEAELEEFRASYGELGSPCIPREDLPFIRHHLFTPDRPVHWTRGWDLFSHREIPVPSSMICMDGKAGRRDLQPFQLTSNGLASGNNVLEAINAGLFEVIERDAVTCHQLAWGRGHRLPPVVDLKTVPFPLVCDLLDRLWAAGLGVTLFDCTLDTRVPVYMAYLNDPTPQDSLGNYTGYGAHLDPEVAMSRALTEAVQGRLNYIAGSRDDLFRHSYASFERSLTTGSAQKLHTLSSSVNARDRTSNATPTFEGDTQLALRWLQQAGLDQAIVIDLSRPDFPIKVVKVIVPRLEGCMSDNFEPGPRALAFLAGGAE